MQYTYHKELRELQQVVFNELSVRALHDNKIGKLDGALLP